MFCACFFPSEMLAVCSKKIGLYHDHTKIVTGNVTGHIVKSKQWKSEENPAGCYLSKSTVTLSMATMRDSGSCGMAGAAGKKLGFSSASVGDHWSLCLPVDRGYIILGDGVLTVTVLTLGAAVNFGGVLLHIH